MKKHLYILTLSIAIFLSSCSSRLLVTSGAKSNEPLIFNGEYKFDTLEPITVEGKAIFGIPTSSHLGQYKNKNGFLFTFNGVEMGKTRKIIPFLTMVTFSFYSARLVQAIGGEKPIYEKIGGRSYIVGYEDRIKFLPALILGSPIAGAANNLLWQSSAFSGASSTFRYRLIEENPGIDLFIYPKYNVECKSGIWTQSSSLTGRAIGASLIMSPPKPIVETQVIYKPSPEIPAVPVIPPTKPKK
ncbi:MAG: hypothetical protein FJX91_06295 [Bacteroidetes bacterium]|nr:hypothetical protein [Bacteroidota bacterium]